MTRVGHSLSQVEAAVTASETETPVSRTPIALAAENIKLQTLPWLGYFAIMVPTSSWTSFATSKAAEKSWM